VKKFYLTKVSELEVWGKKQLSSEAGLQLWGTSK